MSRRVTGAPRANRGAQRGQVIVLFALSVVAMTAMAGLLIDGAMAWAQQRQAQAAADTAALAAAAEATYGDSGTLASAAQDVASTNGFPADLTDCSGATQPNKGVVVNRPPASGPHSAANDPKASSYVEVIATRAMHTTFAGVVGVRCWLLSARAVASIASPGVATCNLCILSDYQNNTTLMLNNNANLRVDGDVIVNQDNWYYGNSTPATKVCPTSPAGNPKHCFDPLSTIYLQGALTDLPVIQMGGDSVWLDQSNAGHTHLSARTISITGGWQAQNHDYMTADELAPVCPYHQEPAAYALLGVTPVPVANVCQGTPKLADPLNDPAHPENFVPAPDPSTSSVPVKGQSGCPDTPDVVVPTGTLASPAKLQIGGGPNGTYLRTICPGIYYGGFSVSGDDTATYKVTMLPGIYFMIGGGFAVNGLADIDGSAGVMIYNSSGSESFSESTLPGTDLVPACNPALPSQCVAPIITNTGNGISGAPSGIVINQTVTYTMRVQRNSSSYPTPTGLISFYDGQNLIPGCGNLTAVPVPGQPTKAQAQCQTSYPLFGTRGITGVYYGDSIYAPIGDAMIETINPPSGEAAQIIDLTTNISGSHPKCTPGWPCGEVILHAPTTGDYAGILIFQARNTGVGIKIWPAAGAPACTGNWMTDGVPPDTNPVPAPCGALGGLSGTIYAPHQDTGNGDADATVNLNAPGLANLQIIAAELNMLYDESARFAYDPSAFANGKLHLVE